MCIDLGVPHRAQFIAWCWWGFACLIGHEFLRHLVQARAPPPRRLDPCCLHPTCRRYHRIPAEQRNNTTTKPFAHHNRTPWRPEVQSPTSPSPSTRPLKTNEPTTSSTRCQHPSPTPRTRRQRAKRVVKPRNPKQWRPRPKRLLRAGQRRVARAAEAC
jgi:hypothetical protein